MENWVGDRVNVSALLRPAIYFLYWKGEVVYVGQSVLPLKRIYTHASRSRGRSVSFDGMEILPTPINRLDAEEKAWIAHYQPKWNVQHKKSPIKIDLTAVLSLRSPKEVIIKRRL